MSCDVFIDGDFPSGKGACKHHCSPTCHPGQVDENDWHYGCLHPAWPQNRVHDFCPFVKCDGDPNKCEVPIKYLISLRRGAMVRFCNAKKKMDKASYDMKEYGEMIDRIKGANRG